MTDNILKSLVTEAVSLDREINEKTDRLKELKAELVAEAQSRESELASTDSGGMRWTAEGGDGCIARVNFPAPTLKAKIDEEGKVLEKIKDLAGGVFTRLFVPTVSYRPVERFREEASRVAPESRRKQADQALPERQRTPRQLRDHRTRSRLIRSDLRCGSTTTSVPRSAADATRSAGPSRMLATKLQLAGFDISRSGVSKIEARLRFVDDKDLMFLAEVLKVPIQELFPRRESAGRLSDFMQKLETTRF